MSIKYGQAYVCKSLWSINIIHMKLCTSIHKHLWQIPKRNLTLLPFVLVEINWTYQGNCVIGTHQRIMPFYVYSNIDNILFKGIIFNFDTR